MSDIDNTTQIVHMKSKSFHWKMDQKLVIHWRENATAVCKFQPAEKTKQ